MRNELQEVQRIKIYDLKRKWMQSMMECFKDSLQIITIQENICDEEEEIMICGECEMEVEEDLVCRRCWENEFIINKNEYE